VNVLRQDGKYEIISTSHRKIRYQESLQNRFFKTFLRGKHWGKPNFSIYEVLRGFIRKLSVFHGF